MYRQGAELGQTPAQANLGVLYLGGPGVTNDLVQAYVWCS
jgi:TPR repeat protein